VTGTSTRSSKGRSTAIVTRSVRCAGVCSPRFAPSRGGGSGRPRPRTSPRRHCCSSSSRCARARIREPERLASFALGICRNLAREGARVDERRRALLEKYGLTESDLVDARGPLEVQRSHLEDCGTLDLWRTAREVEELVASGRRVRIFDIDLANPTPPDLSGDFDIFVTKVSIDLTGIRRCDLEVFTLDGRLLKKIPDIAFDPDDGALFLCCEAELARVSASVKAVSRLWGWSEDESERRLLAEYVSP